MKGGRILIFVAGMCAAVIATAQEERDVATHQHAWYMAFGNHRITEALGVHTEYQFRRTGLGEDWQQSLMRVGIDWHRDNNHFATMGYGWIRSYAYGEQPNAERFDEHRIWQQFITQSNTGNFNWTHRYRLEQRFMDRPTGASWQHRARYFVQVSWTLPNQSNWFLSAYEEAFIGLRDLDNLTNNLLQQNRLSAAINYRWNNGTSVQVGGLQQLLIKGNGQAERNQTLLIGLRHNLDFRD